MRQIGKAEERAVEPRQRFVVAAVGAFPLFLEPFEVVFGDRPGHAVRVAHERPTTPSSGLLADAYIRRAMRPDSNARRPACTA